jgi:hypothetical protein
VTGVRDDERVVAGIRDVLARSATQLGTAGARDEALATFIPGRRVLFFTKDAVMVPVSRVWRLGVFLLDRDGTLHETGATTRAVPPGHVGYQSVSAESRRGYRAAAFRGPFTRGETVNFDAAAISLDAGSLRSSPGPLFLHRGRALVRWSASAPGDTAIDFAAYLADRVSLLVSPPEGA